jgi:hypothetical protein
LSVKAISIASGAQVGHWMSVVERWQSELGEDWDRLYAVNNTMYVTRQNNILYSVVVQFMGTETMGDRLLFVETAEFETTPEKLLDVLGRIVADRSLGMVFFRDFFAMDVELLGGGGRAAIEHEMTKRGQTAVLPSLAPFRSNDWPWKTDPTKGNGPAQLGTQSQAAQSANSGEGVSAPREWRPPPRCRPHGSATGESSRP